MDIRLDPQTILKSWFVGLHGITAMNLGLLVYWIGHASI